MEVIGKIDPALYWEWRTTIEENVSAKLKLELAQLKLTLMEKELELMRLRTNIYKSTEIISKKEKVDLAEKEYQLIKNRIEEASGVELKDDCVIDGITYEIKRLGNSA